MPEENQPLPAAVANGTAGNSIELQRTLRGFWDEFEKSDFSLPAAVASPQPCARELPVVDLLTVDELAEIDAREKAATRGVDVPAGGDDWYSAALPEDVEGHDMWPIYTDGNGGVDTIGFCYLPANASFAAHARQDIPRLRKHIDEQSAEIYRLKQEIHEWEESDAARTVLYPIFADISNENERLKREISALQGAGQRAAAGKGSDS